MILLVAYGMRSYGAYATNLARSIKKYNSDIKIQLVCDRFNYYTIDLSLFCAVTMKPDDYFLDPCRVKLCLDELTVFKKTLYLDVDAIALKDITPLIEHFEKTKDALYIPALGIGSALDEKVAGAHWCKPSVWMNHYGLEFNGSSFNYGLQTSMVFWDSEKTQNYWNYLKALYTPAKRIPKVKLTNTWGQSMQFPDELFHTIACYAFGVKIDTALQPIFFPDEERDTTYIFDRYYFLSQFGNINVLPYAFRLYDLVVTRMGYYGEKGSSIKAGELYLNKFTRSAKGVYDN